MKKNKIKYISKLLVLSILVLSTVSCYDDFVENEFEFTSVYLPLETIDRTFIMEEGLQIGVGVVLGGRLQNNEDVIVEFSLDESLLATDDTKLPDDYYTLLDSEGNPADNKIIIPAGKTQGFVYVKADSIKVLEDPLSLGHNYALGFTLNNVINADSILIDPLSTKFKSTKIRFSYINQLYGNYIQTGQFVKTPVDDPLTTEDESLNAETIDYPGGITDVLELTMETPNTLVYDGLADLRGADKKLNLTIDYTDNSITIESATGGVTVTNDGGSSYDPVTREIKLNYSFEFNGFTYKASDILEFRNRIVDGVNQVDL